MAGSKTSTKASLFLSMNLLCYVLTAAACNNCPPRPTQPSGGGSGGFRPAAQQPPTCQSEIVELGVCAALLGAGVVVGQPQTIPCCNLLEGLADLEVASCLCTAIKENVLGIKLDAAAPLAIRLLMNICGRTPPSGFTCA